MIGALKIFSRVVLVLVMCLNYSWALAQNEIARERSSLKGIQSMGFTVNLETNAPLTQHGEIDVISLSEMGEITLRNGGISLIPDNEVEGSDETPFLYLHVNAMDAGQGLIPFSISLYFYQPVKLTLNRGLQTSSVTWESGTLGIVSYDRIPLISDAAEKLLKEFITDYNQINNSN